MSLGLVSWCPCARCGSGHDIVMAGAPGAIQHGQPMALLCAQTWRRSICLPRCVSAAGGLHQYSDRPGQRGNPSDDQLSAHENGRRFFAEKRAKSEEIWSTRQFDQIAACCREASGALDQQEPVALGWYKDEVVVVSQGVFTSTGMVMEDTPAGAATVKVIFPSGLNGRIPAVAVSRAA